MDTSCRKTLLVPRSSPCSSSYPSSSSSSWPTGSRDEMPEVKAGTAPVSWSFLRSVCLIISKITQWSSERHTHTHTEWAPVSLFRTSHLLFRLCLDDTQTVFSPSVYCDDATHYELTCCSHSIILLLSYFLHFWTCLLHWHIIHFSVVVFVFF